VEASLERAQKTYKKVYPHPNTSHIIYGAKKKEKIARLNLEPVLTHLKKVGKSIETYRPTVNKKQSKNILVPRFYFLVTNRPHKKGGSHTREFIYVDLDLDSSKRLLTRNKNDGVFTGKKGTDEYYFAQAKKDYVKGEMALGVSKSDAENAFTKVCNGQKEESLVHSERVLLEMLRDEKIIDSIIKSLQQQIAEKFKTEGTYKVYTALLMLYSTNSVCQYCAPSLISGQNSYEEGGFLNLLTSKLNKLKGNIQFKTRGYDKERKKQRPEKFRLTTIVTANTNFDEQAHDLTEEGQHRHTSIGKNNAPKKHIPHGQLFFPDDAIDVHLEPLKNDKPDSSQPFFYEFCGGDLHTDSSKLQDKDKAPFPGIVFSSGTPSWGDKIPSTLLDSVVTR
jgi:hypothetical protein